ncbi:MAG: hypothetical protein PHO56_04185 [Patescibacteria group bacterium]|nr:hypothetical protein [Patescibacteria group bacterium]
MKKREVVDFKSSLKFYQTKLIAIYERHGWHAGELPNLLQDCRFSRIFSGISDIITAPSQQEVIIAERELKNFIEKAEEFKKKNDDFADWWPLPLWGIPTAEGEAMLNRAYKSILSREASVYEYFALFVGIAQKMLDVIKQYEALNNIIESMQRIHLSPGRLVSPIIKIFDERFLIASKCLGD